MQQASAYENSNDLAGEIAKLGNFIIQEIDGEPSRDEGACDTAIRLLRERKKTDLSASKTFLLEEVEAIEKKAINEEKFTLNEGWRATLRNLAEAAYGLKVRIERATVKEVGSGAAGEPGICPR